MSNIITSTIPGNLNTDGLYVDQIPPTPAIGTGAATGRIGISGPCNWGPIGQAIPFSNPATDGQAAFGNGTGLAHSLILAAMVASPECIDFLGTRVDDGTSTAAVIAMKDTLGSPATIITLTAKNTGSLPNPPNGVAASAFATLQSGTATGTPLVALAISFPGFTQEVYANVVAYATPGSGFDAPTYKANVLAAINGTAPNSSASPNWTASAGAGTAFPNTTATYSATGGTDGAGVTTSQLIGNPTLQTGIYAMSGQLSGGQLLVADLTDGSVSGTLTAYATTENCLVHMANTTSQTTAQDITFRAANNLSNASLVYSVDWDYMFDQFAGIQRLVNPSSKVAGVIAGQPAYMYPGNKPAGGVAGVTATERTKSPVQTAEGGQRETNGILYLTNNPNLFNQGTGYGLPHGIASDGVTLISDVRMLKKISFDMRPVLGPLVGLMQSTAVNDEIRKEANDRLDAYFLDLKTGSPRQIDDYQVILNATNNTVLTIGQGKLISAISVKTLAAVRYIVALLQVGSTVQLQIKTAA